MSFFKTIHPAPRGRSRLSDLLAPLAAVVLAEQATLWRTLDMLRTISVSLKFDGRKLVYMRQVWGCHDILRPTAGTALDNLIWHLLGAPKSVRDHDQAMRYLAMDLAWYQTTRYIPCTPPEIKEIVYYYGQSTPPDVIYMLVEEQFSGMRRGEDFYLMLRQFKNSLTRSQYVEAHAGQGGDA